MSDRSTAGRARRSRVLAGAGLLALAGSLMTATPAVAAPPGCDNRTNNSIAKLTECVTLEGVREHLEAFQGFADAHGDTRASGTPGYDASAAYVAEAAERAGLEVTTQTFDFAFYRELAPGTLTQVSPTATEYPAAEVFTGTYSGSGDVTATVEAVDVQIPPAPVPGSTSGCEAADFATFTEDNIALLQRGTCDFAVKAANAQAAGAAAVIIFNEGQPGRTEAFGGTLGAPDFTIPVVFTSFATGADLYDPAGTTARVTTSTESEIRPTTNVFAETTRGATDSVLMVGAHLDSVAAGPGINDNGTGSAAILEVARLIAKVRTEQTIRFAWWGAEELGLLGSEFYVADLQATDPAELDRISAYLNFDMVGSPNFARFVYDGDDSDAVGAPAGPEGSAAIEDVFQTFYTERGLAYEGTDFTGRSDYGPFIAAGVDIPSGGLFTGAEGVKTPEQAARYGGTAGVAFDENYHEAGDTIANVNDEVLDQNADAIAYATYTLATSTELVANPAVADTPGDVGSGGGLHDHDHELASS
jgi:Zn-dependent M28 family amino/carboxypeptidase